MKKLHDGLKLVGRAVTAVFMPTRPDLMEAVRTEGDARGIRVHVTSGWLTTCRKGMWWLPTCLTRFGTAHL